MTETMSIFTYVKGFQQFETSYTAAVALLIIVLLSVIVFAGAQARGAGAMMTVRTTPTHPAGAAPGRRGRCSPCSSCSRSTGCS